jgi:tetratricopeptide (TPR) repeat protein/predicted Ser/Thr protein kinase
MTLVLREGGRKFLDAWNFSAGVPLLGVGAGEEPPSEGGIETQAMRRAVEARLFGEAAEPVQVGRFVLGERIGRGGMGVVYRAHDPELDREVAIKIVRRDPGASSGADAERMLKEARALARLSHPNVVSVLDVGRTGDGIYIAMELVVGRTLLEYCRDRLGDRKTRCARIVELARQAASGLAAAHDAGIVHRDVKPSNILVGDDGRVRIIDFGLARAASDEPGAEPRVTADGTSADRLTATGEVAGTPAYMAPEQDSPPARSPTSSPRLLHKATARSDQFAWALSFWEALFDAPPYSGRTRLELREAMQAGRIAPPPEGHAVPRHVRRVLERALVPWPAERYEDMHDVANALARRSRKSIALVAAATAALGVAWVLLPGTIDRASSCASTAREIEASWGPAEREALRTAVLGDGGPIGTETWSRLEPRLDHFVASWVNTRTAVCLAARQPSVDTSIACLDQRRRTFEHRIALLATADASAASRALQLAATLPSVTDCNDPTWLHAQVKPPEDADLDAAATEAADQIDEVGALVSLGRAEEALPRIDELVVATERMGYGPVLARALHVRGFAQDELGHDEDALEDYRRAYFLAMENGDYGRAAESAAEVAYVHGDRLRQVDEADEWLGHMSAALERAPAGDATLRARCEVRRATVLRRKGDRPAALAAVEAAVTAFVAAEGEDDVRIPGALVIAIDVHRELGDPEAATRAGERALAIAQSTLGPSHPTTSEIHGSLCGVALEHRDMDSARVHCRQAHAGALAAPERDSPTLAGTINNLGFLAVNDGELEQALSHFEEALGLLERSGRSEHPYAAQTLQNIALCLEQLGRSEESLAAMDRSIEITERGRDPLATAIALYNAGTVAHGKRMFDRATQYLGRAVETAGPEHRSHPVVIEAKSMLGAMHVDRGEAERGLPLLEEARRGFDADPQRSPRSAAANGLYLARALVDTGDDEARAMEIARRARDDFAALDPPDPEGAAAVEELLREHDHR